MSIIITKRFALRFNNRIDYVDLRCRRRIYFTIEEYKRTFQSSYDSYGFGEVVKKVEHLEKFWKSVKWKLIIIAARYLIGKNASMKIL